jgi:drug/metabolite transporter (DMT)-like permease
MGFSTVAMKFVPVGEGALIVYTMPIWATLLAWPLAGIRPKLVPLIGVISAALILGEPLGLREVVAMVLTLGGVTLALQRA